MKLLAVLNIIVLLRTECGIAFDSYEDYFEDPILNYLLNGNETELSEFKDGGHGELNDGSEPVLFEGIWKCGSCDDIDENREIYSEMNDVDTNIANDNFLQVQIGLAFEEMHCVTIQSDEELEAKIITGSCAGPTITIAVANARHFVVRVYGE
ncbi:unnamed protein product, partial [Iphiclides podalirius]